MNGLKELFPTNPTAKTKNTGSRPREGHCKNYWKRNHRPTAPEPENEIYRPACLNKYSFTTTPASRNRLCCSFIQNTNRYRCSLDSELKTWITPGKRTFPFQPLSREKPKFIARRIQWWFTAVAETDQIPIRYQNLFGHSQSTANQQE